MFRLPGFLLFWTADTVSEFGAYITTIALQVLVVTTLGGTATEVGLLNASRWTPYLVLGLLVGVYVERWRRKPIMVSTDLGRAVLLGTIPTLWLLGWLTLPLLLLLVGLFGFLSLLNDSAAQSFVPRLVPTTDLLAAHARRDQSEAVAQTTGPALGGGLASAVGAPFAILVNCVTYVFAALAVARVRIQEPPATVEANPNLGHQIVGGLRWVYRHPTLTPLAVATHGWFLCHSVLTTIYVPFVLVELQLSAFELGLTLAAAGAAALVGALIATRVGLRWGAGWTVIACQVVMPFAWIVIALTPSGAASGQVLLIAPLVVGQSLYGLAMGASNANEMGYRQAITPDSLQARMNTTLRSLNRGMIVAGAPLGGVLADSVGYRPTFAIAIAGLALIALILAVSPFRRARHSDGTIP